MSLRDEIQAAQNQLGSGSLSDEISQAKKKMMEEDAAAKPVATPLPSLPATQPSGDLRAEIEKAKTDLLSPEKLEQAEDNVLERTVAGMPVDRESLNVAAGRIQDKQEGVDLFKTISSPVGGMYASLGQSFVKKVLGSEFTKNVVKAATGKAEVSGAVKYTPANLASQVGSRISSEQVLDAVGMPSSAPLPVEVKYGPMIGQALKGVEAVTGIPVDKMPDRLMLGAFIDTCVGVGATKLLSKLAASTTLRANPEQVSTVIKEWANSSPELINFMEREIARQEAGMKPTGPQMEAIKEQLSSMLWNESTVAPDEIVVGSTKFKNINGQWLATKSASEMDALKAAKNTIEETKEMTAASETATKAAIEAKVSLPSEGQADLPVGVGVSHWLSSPRYVVPALYELHSEKVGTMAAMKNSYWKTLEPFADLQKSPDRLELIGKILDGVANHEEVMDSWTLLTKHEVEAVQAFRGAWDTMADKLYEVTQSPSLKPGQRIMTYMTHIVKDHMIPNKIRVPDRLQKMVEMGEGFTKARSGAEGFSLNPFEAFDEYITWASEKVADAAIMPRWEEIIRTYDPHLASYGKWFWNNVHRISNAPSATKRAIESVRNNIYSATLGWNISASLVNRSQSFLFGSARIGYGPFVRGIKLAESAKQTTAEGLRVKEILNNSGIFDDLSEFIVNKHYRGGESWKEKYANQSMKWFSDSERWNKSVTYLGSYEDTLNMIKQVKDAPGAFPETSRRLQQLKVDLSKEATDEAHKVAFRAVMDTQLDMSKAGQNYLSSNPLLGLFTMYSSFPIKATEYVANTLTKAAKKVLRDPLRFYHHQEVQEATRFGINACVVYTVLAAAGVAPSNIVGPENFLPNMSPGLKMLMRSWSTAQSVAENASSILAGQKSVLGLFDPSFQKDSYLSSKGKQMLLRDISMLSGIPGAAQGWKIFKFTKIVMDNLDNKTGVWNIYDPNSGALKYRTSPVSVLKTLFLPSQDEEHYFQQAREDFSATEKMKNAGRAVQKLLMEGRAQEAAEVAKQFGVRSRLTRTSRQRRNMTESERRERRNRGKRQR